MRRIKRIEKRKVKDGACSRREVAATLICVRVHLWAADRRRTRLYAYALALNVWPDRYLIACLSRQHSRVRRCVYYSRYRYESGTACSACDCCRRNLDRCETHMARRADWCHGSEWNHALQEYQPPDYPIPPCLPLRPFNCRDFLENVQLFLRFNFNSILIILTHNFIFT